MACSLASKNAAGVPTMSRWDDFRPESQVTPPRWEKARQQPAQPFRRWGRRTSPVWASKAALLDVFEVYRAWYRLGLSDREISHRIRTTYGEG